MVRQFFLSVSVLLLLSVGMLLHYMASDSSAKQQAMRTLVALTGIHTPSLSTAYYEPRVMPYQQISNPAYPQMQTINRMDFVYAE